MSRAFTREIDDAPPEPTPERPISPARNLVTPRGATLIEDAIDRAELATGPEAARELRYWRARRASMMVVQRSGGPAIGFGATATILRNGRRLTITIVGEDEADPTAGLIAWTSPLAQALDGAEAGDSVVLERGGRSETITVDAVA
jgi:transcription elongation factor GreB